MATPCPVVKHKITPAISQTLLACSGGGFPEMPGWHRRASFTIDSTKVSADQTDFAALIFADDSESSLGSDLYDEIASDGKDVRVAEADKKTLVPSYVEHIDTGAADELRVFCRLDPLAATDTVYYLYWNNANATAPARDATYGLENVVSAYQQYYGALPPVGDADPCWQDCGGDEIDLSRKAGKDFDLITGSPFNKAASFPLLGNGMFNTTDLRASSYPITYECRVNHANATSGLPIMANSDVLSVQDAFWLQINTSTGQVQFVSIDSGTLRAMTSTTVVANNGWHTVTATMVNSTDWKLYINGVLEATYTTPAQNSPSAPWIMIGYVELYDVTGQGNDAFPSNVGAEIGMASWYKGERDADYALTSHNALSDPTSFVKSWGTAEWHD